MTSERRFRAYNVGLPKTGTSSIAGIFGRYRSAHEFRMEQTTRDISDFRGGLIAREEFRARVLRRDAEGGLEMDSASFNHAFLDILVGTFPEARFVFTVRDCYSWLDSVLHMGLLLHPLPAWMDDFLTRGLGLRVTPETFASRNGLVTDLPHILDTVLEYWATWNRRVLELLPDHRSLVVRTSEISGSLDRLAALVDAPVGTLLPQESHRFRAGRRFSVLHQVDRAFLEERFERHCGTLTRELFPDHSLQRFLEANWFLAVTAGR